MFCIYCGTRIPEHAAFCPACGAKVAVVNVEEKERPTGMRAAVCASCGSNNLKRVGKGEYLCEHCGSRFFTEEEDDVLSPEEKKAKLLAVFAEAEGCADKGDHQAELSVLSKGLELVPDDCTLLLKLGRACAKLHLVQETMDYYRKAEKANPNDPIVYVNQAVEYLKLDMPAEAKPLLEKALDMMDADPLSASAGDTAVTYGNYALCLGKLGDRAGARKYLNLAKTKGYSKQSVDNICRMLKIRV